jgi:hypothetical protein
MEPTPSGNGASAGATATTSHIVRSRLVVMALAVAVGLVLQYLLREHLAALDGLAKTDPFGARRRFATELRFGGFGLFGLTAALGGWFMVISARAFRVARFPPPGVSTWSVARTATGAAARRMAVVGLMLGSLLVGASIAAGAITWKMAEALLACRAT